MEATLTYSETLEHKCKRNGILLDTELLLVLTVGLLDPHRIPRFKKTQKYVIDDYQYLQRLASQFSPLYVSPQILAELSNHADMLGAYLVTQFYKNSFELLRSQFEVYVSKDDMLTELMLADFGFTDTSLYKLCVAKNCVLFTADRKLAGKMTSRGVAVVDYNVIKTKLWLGP